METMNRPRLAAVTALSGHRLKLTFVDGSINTVSLAGRATLRGLRISVAHVIKLVANGMTLAQIVAEHPDLEEEDIRQALGYAAAKVRA